MATRPLPVSAVIFDCDGVLVNSEEIAQDVEVAAERVVPDWAEAAALFDQLSASPIQS